MLIVNGKLVEAGAPELTLLNRSFKYGDGLFETLRVYKGAIMMLDAHLERLRRGMELLKFDFAPEFFLPRIQEEIERLLVVNQIQAHGRIRLHVYRSGAGTYKPLEDEPFYLLEGYSLKDDYYAHNAPISLTDYHDFPLSPHPLSGVKSANALPYILAARHAREMGYDEALLFHGKYIAEASSANLFIVHQQKILTPPLSEGGLPGIMRQQVIQLAERLKLVCQEKRLRPKDLRQADEIFLTNSIRGMIPVDQYQNLKLDVKRYALLPFLQRCWVQWVEESMLV
ncbi:MAG: aminotransferase class IV [Bacteroidota bacterium]